MRWWKQRVVLHLVMLWVPCDLKWWPGSLYRDTMCFSIRVFLYWKIFFHCWPDVGLIFQVMGYDWFSLSKWCCFLRKILGIKFFCLDDLWKKVLKVLQQHYQIFPELLQSNNKAMILKVLQRNTVILFYKNTILKKRKTTVEVLQNNIKKYFP